MSISSNNLSLGFLINNLCNLIKSFNSFLFCLFFSSLFSSSTLSCNPFIFASKSTKSFFNLVLSFVIFSLLLIISSFFSCDLFAIDSSFGKFFNCFTLLDASFTKSSNLFCVFVLERFGSSFFG